MQLTLVVQTGDSSGRRFVADGQALRVGRVAPAEVCVLDDPMLSASHFCIEAQEQGFVLRDLKSRFGTQVNGKPVSEAPLQHGDTIIAGRTRFVVEVLAAGHLAQTSVVDATPIPRQLAREDELRSSADESKRKAAVLAYLRKQRNLHTVLDAARDPVVLERVVASGLRHESLYDGEKGAEIAAFGPWLVEIPKGSPFLELLVNEGWSDSWGVYLSASASFDEIRKHLRRFLLAKLPDGREVYFRYYDPRVLRTYVQTCTPVELGAFFGPIARYFAESADEEFLFAFGPTFKEWDKVSLDAEAEVPA